jgi:hypothetical protein
MFNQFGIRKKVVITEVSNVDIESYSAQYRTFCMVQAPNHVEEEDSEGGGVVAAVVAWGSILGQEVQVGDSVDQQSSTN